MLNHATEARYTKENQPRINADETRIKTIKSSIALKARKVVFDSEVRNRVLFLAVLI
jgi:hypothetical protein